MLEETITIRPLHTLDEMRAVAELQHTYWGSDEEATVPAHMLFSLANYGGHVLAAFDGERLVGALIGFLGTHIEESHRPAMANLQLVSKRMVVHPDYRSRGIGYRLKLAQRDLSIKQGVRLVTWTFDPLMTANAHLNVRKLGGICPRYLVDYYGTTPGGGLVEFGTSDRLLVEWWVTNRRVEERLFGRRGDLSLAAYLEANTPILNPTDLDGDGLPCPSDYVTTPRGTLALVEIPTDYRALAAHSEPLARAWRQHVRQVFTGLVDGHFLVTDFLRAQHGGRDRAFYLLSFNVGFDFSRN